MVKKLILWPLAAILLVATVFVVNLLAFRPFSINHFFEKVFIEFAFDSPELLTSIRVLKGTPLHFYEDDLDDYSKARNDKLIKRMKRDYGRLQAYKDSGLSESQLLSKRVMGEFMEMQIALTDEFRFHNYPVNQLFGIQNGYPEFMAVQHWVETPREAEAYISRLTKVGAQFDQVIEGLHTREGKGILPPTFVVDRVLEEMRAFTATPAKESILYTSFAEKMNKSEFLDEDNAAFLEQAEHEILTAVYPAYARLIAYFEAVRPKTTSDDGVWKFPDGERYYNLKLREATTTNLTADEIHQHGLAEVARIQSDMLQILQGTGYDTSQGFSYAMQLLADDPDQYFDDSSQGREEILQGYRDILVEIDGQLEPWFRLRHKSPIEVRRIPEFREKTAPGAYYNQPSLDGSRPGIFFANLYDIKVTTKWGMRTLAYHEGVPGHHLQKAVQSELTGLPTFRKLLGFTAYAEGWALYAERVASEMGLEEQPLDNLGRMQAELFRAVRLVVDTGIHRKRWTREQAIEYMSENTGMPETDVVAEIERYIVMPAQATAYKTGMDFILMLRERAKTALGDNFDIRDFHDVILRNGDLPLSLLEEQVDAWIAQSQA
jgi:uncharacterized protein (DUF885 family)